MAQLKFVLADQEMQRDEYWHQDLMQSGRVGHDGDEQVYVLGSRPVTWRPVSNHRWGNGGDEDVAEASPVSGFGLVQIGSWGWTLANFEPVKTTAPPRRALVLGRNGGRSYEVDAGRRLGKGLAITGVAGSDRWELFFHAFDSHAADDSGAASTEQEEQSPPASPPPRPVERLAKYQQDGHIPAVSFVAGAEAFRGSNEPEVLGSATNLSVRFAGVTAETKDRFSGEDRQMVAAVTFFGQRHGVHQEHEDEQLGDELSVHIGNVFVETDERWFDFNTREETVRKAWQRGKDMSKPVPLRPFLAEICWHGWRAAWREDLIRNALSGGP